MLIRKPAAVEMLIGPHLGPSGLVPSLAQLQLAPGNCPMAVTPSGLSAVYDNPSAGVPGAWQPRGRRMVPTNFQPEGTVRLNAVSPLAGSFTSTCCVPLQVTLAAPTGLRPLVCDPDALLLR